MRVLDCTLVQAIRHEAGQGLACTNKTTWSLCAKCCLGTIFEWMGDTMQLLEYHVVPGVTVMAANLTDGQMLQTALPGQTLKVPLTFKISNKNSKWCVLSMMQPVSLFAQYGSYIR